MSAASVSNSESEHPESPKWRPLSRIQRRIAGVLVEKAKTTPENYPLSLNAITTGCNQKSNRNPQMELDGDDVEIALDELRELGVVVEVQGSGRVAKYKHCLYEWLGVDKVEMAVMAELLLRGEQTVGELRGRAARMEPIASLEALRPVLDSLIAKRLVIELTPAGRGQMVTHNLFEPQEMRKVKEQVGNMPTGVEDRGEPQRSAASRSERSTAVMDDAYEDLRREVEAMRLEVDRLKSELNELRLLLS